MYVILQKIQNFQNFKKSYIPTIKFVRKHSVREISTFTTRFQILVEIGTGTITETDSSGTINRSTEKASAFLAQSIFTDYFGIWSNEEIDSSSAYLRYFDSNQTYLNSNGRGGDGGLAVCLEE